MLRRKAELQKSPAVRFLEIDEEFSLDALFRRQSPSASLPSRARTASGTSGPVSKQQRDMAGPIAARMFSALAPMSSMRRTTEPIISATVPFQPLCAAATMPAFGSRNSTGTQSAVHTQSGTSFRSVMSPSQSSGGCGSGGMARSASVT